MNPDLYGAWLTAGVALAVIGWAWWPRDDYRSRNDRVAARRITRIDDRPEPGQPGQDQMLLAKCQAICPDLARKEKP